jgi:hypothetical protein
MAHGPSDMGSVQERARRLGAALCPGSSADVASGTGSYVGSRASRVTPGHHLRSGRA